MRPLLICLFLVVASPTIAQEKFIGSNVDLRTVLAFKVSDAAVQKKLPEGWEINPSGGLDPRKVSTWWSCWSIEFCHRMPTASR